jgi:thermitase
MTFAKLVPSSRLPLAFALLSGLLLAACSQNKVPAAGAGRPAYLAQVATAGQSAEGLAERYGAQVLSFDAVSGVALLGFERNPAAQASNGRSLSAQALSAQGLSGVESNARSFTAEGRSTLWATGRATVWASGRATVWATGRATVWATGRSTLWASGQYQMVQENTVSFRQIGLDVAHTALSSPGLGIKVAVIDTGIDLNHVFFQGSLAPAAEWRDFVDGDSVPQEVGTLGQGAYGHGTAVAGIVLEVAPQATILPLRVLDSEGSGDVASVVLAIDYAVQKGARIINLSLGSPERFQLVQDAVNRATAAGVLVVASVGNENTQALNYPAQDMNQKGAAGDNSLSVGSVDSRDQKASFSNYASALEVVAPGEAIFAPGPGDLLVAWSGTSMSAPIATGALALGLSAKPGTDVKKLSAKLINKAASVYENGMNAAYKDMLGKKGRLDVPAFLKDIGN